MSALQVGFNNHLNAYQSVPLLLQFSLSEFFHAYQLFLNIRKLIDEEQFNHTLTAFLAKFSGSATERSKIFYWSPEHGSLAKLYYYASILSEAADNAHLNSSPLEKICRKCWVQSSHLNEAIEVQRYGIVPPILEKLQKSIRQIAKELMKAVTIQKRNENVLFFLLRHRSQIDAAYGENFTIRLIAGLFSNGLDEAKAYMMDKYAERGFFKIAENINDYFCKLNDHSSKMLR